MEGRILGAKYRVVRLTQSGEAGDLYEGVQDSLEKPISIYVPLLADEGASTRFAALATRLSGVGPLRVIDFGVEDDGIGYVVTEKIGKHLLSERVAAGGHIPSAEACRIAIAILDVLGAAHERDVVHAALTTEWVWWDGTSVEISGFALGDTPKIEDQSADTTAPELLHALPADPRTDVFAVGMLLREITGPTATPELSAIIQRATTPSLDGRFQTTRAMRLELATLTGEATGPDAVGARTFQTGSSYGANTTHSILPAPQPSRSPWGWVAGAFVLLLGIGIGVAPKLFDDRMKELESKVDVADYGSAEIIALEHFDDLHTNADAVALVQQALDQRRRSEPGAKAYDPTYALRAGRWDGKVIYNAGESQDPLVIVFEQVGRGWVKGIIESPKLNLRARLVGYWSGNHMVIWDDEVLSGSASARKQYRLYEKTSVYILGEELVGLPGAVGSRLEAKFVKAL